MVALAVVAATNSFSATLAGEVIGLSDGDTITVLDATKTQHKVRLAGIDAPEKRQPFGDKARQHLASQVFRKQVFVDWHKKDRWGRLVGKVMVAGTDAGLQQVRAGLAWHYLDYAKEQTALDRDAYAVAERGARAARVGLWREGYPVAPWDFRKSRRTSPQKDPALL